MIDTSRPGVVLGLCDTGLGAVRSLGQAGIPVLGFDVDPKAPGFASKYCKASTCPDPVRRPEDLIDFLMERGRSLDGPGVLFPSSDAFVLFVSRHRDRLGGCFQFAMPSAEVMEGIVNKRRQYEMVDRSGVPYAKTFYPASMEDVEDIRDVLTYPAFVKPCYSHLWREKLGERQKGFKVEDADDFVACLGEVLETGLEVVVQSVILGPNTNHYKMCAYIDQGGRPKAAFTLRKIRQYPTEFGVGTVVESVDYPELIELGLQFLDSIEYRGIGSIEFKKDERDGVLKMIELNPRLWQQNYHATRCGINFPLVEYLDLTGQSVEPRTEFEKGVKWFDAVSDFRAFLDYFRRGQLSVWAWLGSLRGTRAFATFAWDDPMPFLRANRYGLRYLQLPSYLWGRRRTT